jgi:16S rRNA (guanine966-N2)-methyltransferase
MIKIASGLLRGVQLKTPGGTQTRPSTERLRQSIFNVLRHFRWPPGQNGGAVLEDAVVIDLFAGTGAWGIEAMSNGAGEAWFVESGAGAMRALETNLRTAAKCYDSQGLAVPRMELVRRDVAAAYRRLPEARVIFCDPPYEKGWFEKVLELEAVDPHVAVGGLFIYEARADEPVPDGGRALLRLFDSKIYGDSAVHFFVKLSTG